MNKSIQRPAQYTDERFIAQLGIVSIQSRIDEDSPLSKRWTSEFTIGTTQYHIEGFAADFGRPRGVDTDILLALETKFILLGCPEDDKVVTTPYELMQMVGDDFSGAAYERLKASLLRLWRVGFMVRKGEIEENSTWVRYLNMSLSLIQSVQFSTRGQSGDSGALRGMEEDSKLIIRLAEPFAASIRAGYTHHLDRRLLAGLEQPVARALYRILQAHRPASGPLEVRLHDWANLCGIIATAPDKIRRILTPAHQELVAVGYLEDVVFTGRGSKQEIAYHFRKSNSADPVLVELLTNMRVTRARAKQLAAEYPERVEAAVRYVEQRQQLGKVKNAAALTYDILVKPEKYDLTGELPSVGHAAVPVPDVKELEVQASTQFATQQEALLQLAPEVQWEASRATLKLLVYKHVGEKGMERLRERCVYGDVGATLLTKELSHAKSQGDKVLKARLAELLGEE